MEEDLLKGTPRLEVLVLHFTALQDLPDGRTAMKDYMSKNGRTLVIETNFT